MTRSLLIVLACTLGMASCTINKDIMFKTDQDYVYDTPTLDSIGKEYRLAPNDIITFQLFTNEGSLILEYTTNTIERRQQNFNMRDFTYFIDASGFVELPSIGKIHVAGLTIFEAQDKAEQLYQDEFNNPYALISVMNQRVIVFRGSGADAQVVPLVNNNVSVIEAIALAGGLSERANASKVKLIRKVEGKQEVYLMDLSTIEGIRYANMIVQAGDILYVEPVPEIARGAMEDVAPYVTIISGLAFIYAIFARTF